MDYVDLVWEVQACLEEARLKLRTAQIAARVLGHDANADMLLSMRGTLERYQANHTRAYSDILIPVEEVP